MVKLKLILKVPKDAVDRFVRNIKNNKEYLVVSEVYNINTGRKQVLMKPLYDSPYDLVTQDERDFEIKFKASRE